jgi:hypothetical protein
MCAVAARLSLLPWGTSRLGQLNPRIPEIGIRTCQQRAWVVKTSWAVSPNRRLVLPRLGRMNVNRPETEMRVGMLCASQGEQVEEQLRLDEQRLRALVKLNEMTDASLREITDFALEEAVRLTKGLGQ